MLRNMYVLGRAGSGKSTAAQEIVRLAKKWGWSSEHLFDYSFLFERFRKEVACNTPDAQRVFKQLGEEVEQGFDVKDFGVLNDVLGEMAARLKKQNEEILRLHSNHLRVIEFARQKNNEALEIFNRQGLLANSFLLYVDLDTEECIKRIHRRQGNILPTRFDHIVSDEIMLSYYSRDDWGRKPMVDYLAYVKRDGFKIQTEKIKNDGSKQALVDKVTATLESYLRVPALV